MTDELVLSQENQTQIHHSTCPAVQSPIIWIFFSLWSSLKQMTTEDLTEESVMQDLRSSKQLLNDAMFIWLTDKNQFALATVKNSHNNQLHAHPQQQRRKMFKVLSSNKNDIQSYADGVCTVGMPKFDYNSLILVNPGVKINEICLPYVRSLASSKTVHQYTGYASYLTLIFHKVV